MTVRKGYKSRAQELKARIRAVENRIHDRQGAIDGAVCSVVQNAHTRMTSPAMLITAALLGAAIHRGYRPDGQQVLAVLEALHAGQQFLRTATGSSGTSATPNKVGQGI